MRILNANGDGGKIFKDDGTLRSAEWPKDGYLRCTDKEDQELFQFLEGAEWADGHIYATARWWERNMDELHHGPGYVKGSFVFRGSGIHLHFLDGDSLTRDRLFFLCELPWKRIYDKNEGGFCFVGADRLRQVFLDHIATEQSRTEMKLLWLQRDLIKISDRFQHLRQALQP